MNKGLLLLVISAVLLSGCKKSQSSSSAQDPLEGKLRQLAGNNATNCGRVAPRADVKNASDCALQANQAKRPFYVAYQMPAGDNGQVTVALAGAADGKLYAVEYNPKGGWTYSGTGTQLSEDKTTLTSPCPAPLRVAQSGRVTCYPPPGIGGPNPHGGMMMPPHGGTMSPHGTMPMPPPGTPNPHGGTGVTRELKSSSSN